MATWNNFQPLAVLREQEPRLWNELKVIYAHCTREAKGLIQQSTFDKERVLIVESISSHVNDMKHD